MNTPMVVSNVRMQQFDYMQIKSVASDLGVSVNEFITQSAKDAARQRMTGKLTTKRRSDKETILEAFDRIAKMPNKPMGWSDEDEAIYSI